MYDVTVLGGGGQGFRDNSTKALVITHATMGDGGSKIVQKCVTSFVDDPLLKNTVFPKDKSIDHSWSVKLLKLPNWYMGKILNPKHVEIWFKLRNIILMVNPYYIKWYDVQY